MTRKTRTTRKTRHGRDPDDGDQRRQMWEEWVNDRRWGNAVGDIEPVEALPTVVAERLVRKHRGRIEQAQAMLAVIEATPTVYRRTYGRSQTIEDTDRCVEEVDLSSSEHFEIIRQCPEKRGHGPEGLRCEGHTGGATQTA